MEQNTQNTDKELITMYINGDSNAFNLLVKKYQIILSTFLSFITKDKYLIEDIIQDTFITLLVCIQTGRYKEIGFLRAYLQTIAHNRFVDGTRKKNRLEFISIDILDNQDSDDNWTSSIILKDPEPNPEQKCIKKDLEDLIPVLIESLPEEQKRFVELRYKEGLPYKDIVAITKCNMNTALARNRYALGKMHELAKNY